MSNFLRECEWELDGWCAAGNGDENICEVDMDGFALAELTLANVNTVDWKRSPEAVPAREGGPPVDADANAPPEGTGPLMGINEGERNAPPPS